MAYSLQTDNQGFNSPSTSGGKTVAAFGAINFGSNSRLAGATTTANDTTGSNWLVYALIGLVGLYFLMKR